MDTSPPSLHPENIKSIQKHKTSQNHSIQTNGKAGLEQAGGAHRPPSQASQNPEVATSGEATPETKRPDFPDGGLTAWLQVVGTFFCWFNSWGLTNAFGVFQTYYQSDLLRDQNPSQISWIGALQAFILIFVGILTGPAYDAGYFDVLIWSGTFLVAFGYMMLSLCTQYWQVMLAQGIVIGLGSACLFIPSASIIPQYFLKRRALANGIAAAGSSLGGVIYPIALYKLIPQVGFGWAVRILGFMALGTSAISIAVLRVRIKAPRRRILFDPKALTEPPFLSFTLAMVFGLMGLYIPSFFIESFAVEKGIITGELSAYILPILNAGGVFGRVVPNFFADRTGSLNMLTPCLAFAGMSVLVWIAVVNEGGLIVIALLFGFFSGAILSLAPTSIALLSPSLSVIGTRFGTACAVASIGVLIGTPVSGAILGTSENFVGLQIFAGVILLVGAVFSAASRFFLAGPRLIVKA